MTQISPGSFMMGGSGNRSEAPIHKVQFTKPFAIARNETTFDEYDLFAQVTGRQLPKDEGWGRGQRPVVNVSWDDAEAYAQWLSQRTGKRYRLPTEAEWEYAAQSGGQEQIWPGTSDESQLKDYAVYGTNRTESVGSKKPNRLGLYDMSGNVSEWLEDCWHENYKGVPVDGRPWLEDGDGDCGRRIIRGGSWNYMPVNMRTSTRIWGVADFRNNDLGFRLAQDIP
jgi:formylglycine-generating enzyme required for sulfatase activity